MGGGAGGNHGSHEMMQNAHPWPDPRRNHHGFPGSQHGPGILSGAEEDHGGLGIKGRKEKLVESLLAPDSPRNAIRGKPKPPKSAILPVDAPGQVWQSEIAMTERRNQFSSNRAALSTGGRAKNQSPIINFVKSHDEVVSVRKGRLFNPH